MYSYILVIIANNIVVFQKTKTFLFSDNLEHLELFISKISIGVIDSISRCEQRFILFKTFFGSSQNDLIVLWRFSSSID